MDDKRIIELFFSRDELAIVSAAAKYGGYLSKIAGSILNNDEDTEECVNDTYLKAWNAIPPKEPDPLKTFLGKITRNLALDLYDKKTADKRGGTQVEICLDELSELIPDSGIDNMEQGEITEIINRFLESISKDDRKLFVRRYWYMDPIKKLSHDFLISESNVKTKLFRMRSELKKRFEEEGIEI